MPEKRHSGVPGGGGGGANLLADVVTTTDDTSSGSFTDVANLTSGSVTVAGTGSILLMTATIPIAMESDRTAEYQFAIDGSREGPVCTTFTDATDEGCGVSLTYLKTGLSGSHTFSIQWRTIRGSGTGRDTARNASLQVLELL